jgi:hypothetical protein
MEIEVESDGEGSEDSYLGWTPGETVRAGADHYHLLPFDWDDHPPLETLRRLTSNMEAHPPWHRDEVAVAMENLLNRFPSLQKRRSGGDSFTKNPDAWLWAEEAIALGLRVKYHPKSVRLIQSTLAQKRASKEDQALYGRAKRRATWHKVIQEVEKVLLLEKNLVPPPPSHQPKNNYTGGRGGAHTQGGRGGYRGRGKK